MARKTIYSNKEIRSALKEGHVFQWQLADALGISEATLTRNLRHDLPDEQRREYLSAVERIKGAAEHE